MALYEPGALGEFNGRVGRVIVYRWRHLKIGRAMPGKRKRKKKGTKSQQAQRSRLGLISSYLSLFVRPIRNGYC